MLLDRGLPPDIDVTDVQQRVEESNGNLDALRPVATASNDEYDVVTIRSWDLKLKDTIGVGGDTGWWTRDHHARANQWLGQGKIDHPTANGNHTGDYWARYTNGDDRNLSHTTHVASVVGPA